MGTPSLTASRAGARYDYVLQRFKLFSLICFGSHLIIWEILQLVFWVGNQLFFVPGKFHKLAHSVFDIIQIIFLSRGLWKRKSVAFILPSALIGEFCLIFRFCAQEMLHKQMFHLSWKREWFIKDGQMLPTQRAEVRSASCHWVVPMWSQSCIKVLSELSPSCPKVVSKLSRSCLNVVSK